MHEISFLLDQCKWELGIIEIIDTTIIISNKILLVCYIWDIIRNRIMLIVQCTIIKSRQGTQHIKLRYLFLKICRYLLAINQVLLGAVPMLNELKVQLDIACYSGHISFR